MTTDRIGVVGVVLAGGGSSRMGQDKSTVEIQVQGRPLTLLEWTIDRLETVCQRIVVASGAHALPAGLPERGVRAVPDGPGRGPAAGLLGAAAACPGAQLLVLGVDQPCVPSELLRLIADCSAGTSHLGTPDPDWIVPRRGDQLEPTCSLYGPRALARVAERAAAGRFGLQAIDTDIDPDIDTDGLDMLFLEPDTVLSQPWCELSWDQLFLNLNRPEDVERLETVPGFGKD